MVLLHLYYKMGCSYILKDELTTRHEAEHTSAGARNNGNSIQLAITFATERTCFCLAVVYLSK